MKKLILISALLFSFNGWAYSETDLAKLKALNACESCDLSSANLEGADLSNADLEGANLEGAVLESAILRNVDLQGANLKSTRLKNAKLDEAIFCKTQMPWGEINDDCRE